MFSPSPTLVRLFLTATLVAPTAAAFAQIEGDGKIDVIFSDSFETGDTSAWSSAVNIAPTDIKPKAASVGSFGLSSNPSSVMYVQDDSPLAERGYAAKFFVDPSNLSLQQKSIAIFAAFDTTQRAPVLLLSLSQSQRGILVRAETLTVNGFVAGPWAPLGRGPHLVEVAWTRTPSASKALGLVTLAIDGTFVSQVAGLANPYGIDTIRLGLPNANPAKNSGEIYFDEFEARRLPTIGPGAISN